MAQVQILVFKANAG